MRSSLGNKWKGRFWGFKNMNGFRFLLHSITIGLCLIGQSAWATRAYVTDSFEVTLRTGPSTQNKIIALLPSGTPLEVLGSQDDWSHVCLFQEQREENMEGWILSRYLVTREPWRSQAKYLMKGNARLGEKLARTEEGRVEAAHRAEEVLKKLKNKTRTLRKLQKEHESLKMEATNYLELRATHEATLSTLKTTQKIAQELTLENEKLKSSKRITWFVTGALVLLVGLVIGLGLGKRQKKQRTVLYS